MQLHSKRFQPSTEKLQYGVSSVFGRPRSFRPTLRGRGLSTSFERELTEFAEWRTLFPCINPKSGRTLFAALEPPAANLIAEHSTRAFKMKGGGGLTLSSSGIWTCEPPDPNRDYGPTAEYHIALDAELKLSTVESRPKSWNCLSRTAAETEFECQAALAKAGIGFSPLLAGEYLIPNTGLPEKSSHGWPLGVVFSSFSPDFIELGSFVEFEFLDGPNSPLVVTPENGPLSRERHSANEMMEYVFELICRKAALKKTMALQADVGRHSGHFGNFLYNENRDKLIASDTDTCIFYGRLDPIMRGPQLLRDIAHDLFRDISEFCRMSYSKATLPLMLERGYTPCGHFLHGFFDGLVPGNVIDAHAAHLHHSLRAFLSAMASMFSVLQDSRALGILEPSKAVPEIILRGSWHLNFMPFLEMTIAITYSLMKKSSLADLGFVLPDFGEEIDFQGRLRAELCEHIKLLLAVSEEAKKSHPFFAHEQ